jgi:hypothetical protein
LLDGFKLVSGVQTDARLFAHGLPSMSIRHRSRPSAAPFASAA